MKKPILAALLVLAACSTDKPAEPVAEKPASAGPYVVTLDDTDRTILDRTLQQAATRPTRQIIAWDNPSNGKDGTLTMIRRGYTRDGRHCGEVHYEARLHGYRTQEVKRVCQGTDSRWAPENGF